MVNHMIKVSGKQFRLKFSDYCNCRQSVEVHGRGGIILGIFYPAGTEWIREKEDIEEEE